MTLCSRVVKKPASVRALWVFDGALFCLDHRERAAVAVQQEAAIDTIFGRISDWYGRTINLYDTVIKRQHLAVVAPGARPEVSVWLPPTYGERRHRSGNHAGIYPVS